MFNKETEYALRGLVYIQFQNLSGKKPGVSEIAKEIDAPPFFTAKILQRLTRQGFILSQKGKGGGFYFDKNNPDLSIKDLIMATEGGTILSGCGFGLKHCDINSQCLLHEKYAPIRDAINALVSTETIQSLARKYSHPMIIPLTISPDLKT
jgi:Rrf2 family protein